MPDERPDVRGPVAGVFRMDDRFQWSARLLIGVLVILFGVLLLLDNFHLFEAAAILRWWPVVIVVAGVCRLFALGCPRRPLWGAILTFLGLGLLADSLGALSFSVWELWWPLLLILFGGSMLIRSLGGAAGRGAAADRSDWLRTFAFMSGADRKVQSESFRGGEVTALMGGVDLDLCGAKLDQHHAVVDVFAMWGGIDIRVPTDWKVIVEAVALLGGIGDSRNPAPSGEDTLVVRGLVVMGGVEIKN